MIYYRNGIALDKDECLQAVLDNLETIKMISGMFNESNLQRKNMVQKEALLDGPPGDL